MCIKAGVSSGKEEVIAIETSYKAKYKSDEMFIAMSGLMMWLIKNDVDRISRTIIGLFSLQLKNV